MESGNHSLIDFGRLMGDGLDLVIDFNGSPLNCNLISNYCGGNLAKANHVTECTLTGS